MLSKTTQTSKNQQSRHVKCDAVRSIERVQVKEPAQRIWRLARDVCPGEPLGKKENAASSLSLFAAARYHPNPTKRSYPGQFLPIGLAVLANGVPATPTLYYLCHAGNRQHPFFFPPSFKMLPFYHNSLVLGRYCLLLIIFFI